MDENSPIPTEPQKMKRYSDSGMGNYSSMHMPKRGANSEVVKNANRRSLHDSHRRGNSSLDMTGNEKKSLILLAIKTRFVRYCDILDCFPFKKFVAISGCCHPC